MGFKMLGPLQTASANVPVLLHQELTVHTPDGLALGSGGRGSMRHWGGCLMIEAEFHSLCAYLEASDKEVGVSTDMWLSLPPSPPQ